MSAVIRCATRDDAEVLADLLRRAFRDVAERFGLSRGNAPTHASNCEPGWIHSDFERGVDYFVASSTDAVIGCIALEPAAEAVAYLERLGVSPERRHQGIGAALVRHSVVRARSAGIRRVSVGVIAEHRELVAWYERLGFTLTETRRFPRLPFTVSYLERLV